MDGKHNFISKAMYVVKPMDKMIGPDFEEGLAGLKRVAEARKAATPPPPPPVPVAEAAAGRNRGSREEGAGTRRCQEAGQVNPGSERHAPDGRHVRGRQDSRLLASDAHERQIAAAIVLGEIGARDAAVIDALAAAAADGVPPVQRHALEALARLARGKAARKLMPCVLACLASRDDTVRRAAVDAAIAFGDDAVGARATAAGGGW